MLIEHKPVPAAVAALDQYGAAVAVSGHRIVVGAPGDDDIGPSAGTAYILAFEGDSWVLEQQLLPDVTGTPAGFGRSVDIEGDTVVVAAGTGGSLGTGAVLVFVHDGASWQQLPALAADAPAGGTFGHAVAISGDTIVAGAPGEHAGTMANAGAAYVWRRENGSWGGAARLAPNDPSGGKFFGRSVAVAGETIIVGAEADSEAALIAGAVYVFDRQGNAWTESQKLTLDNPSPGRLLGRSVDFDGELIVASAPGQIGEVGQVHLFVENGGEWSASDVLVASDEPGGGTFGNSVALSGNQIVVGSHFDDDQGGNAGAVYRFQRSGALWEEEKLLGSDTTGGERLGEAVAIDGSTIVAGARSDDDRGVHSGAVYVFAPPGQQWAEKAILTLDDHDPGEYFSRVATSGDTIVVGAHGEGHTGAAYVFIEASGGWVQQEKLEPESSLLGGAFGWSVAIDGDTVVVADVLDSEAASQAGAVYVYVREGSQWRQQAKLLDPAARPHDVFGRSVAIHGDVVGVGAPGSISILGNDPGPGAAYAYVRNGESWALAGTLSAPDGRSGDQFGRSVALDGKTIVVGTFQDPLRANGIAYVFEAGRRGWGHAWTLKPHDTTRDDHGFGSSVAIDGDIIAVGAFGDNDLGLISGSVYIFGRQGHAWDFEQKLYGSEISKYEYFGESVAIDGRWLVVGAGGEDYASSGPGAAYVFARRAGGWTEVAKRTPSDTAAHSRFGSSVAISGERFVGGAPSADFHGSNAGAAWVYELESGSWEEKQRLEAGFGSPADLYGSAVAVEGDTAVVGAVGDAHPSWATGAAYIFEKQGDHWEVEQRLMEPGDPELLDFFGRPVDISGDRIAIGAVNDRNAGGRSGAAYVFARQSDGWALDERLAIGVGAVNDQFGGALAIDGDLLLVGASGDDEAEADAGAVYLFERGAGGWTQQAKLMANDAAAGDRFGRATGLAVDRLIVGAPRVENAAGERVGAAYVFDRDGSGWSQQPALFAGAGSPQAGFGSAVAVDGNIVAVAAPQQPISAATTGAVHIFELQGGTWVETARRTATQPGDTHFGADVALHGTTLIVGASGGAATPPRPGVAYVFRRTGSTWSQRARLVSARSAAGDAFGIAVDLDQDRAIIGAHRGWQGPGWASIFERA